MELVTAVITTHKRAPQIVERALRSIFAQTYPNMEVIVVDDSPADFEQRPQVKETVESLGARYIPHDTCQGACVARNTGLANAGGTYIAYLDDDDEWKPEKIEKQLAGFTSDRVGLVYCAHEIRNDTTGTVVIHEPKYLSGMVYEQLLPDNFIGSTSFPLLRTEALRAVGGFDPLMPSAQDFDTWLRVSQHYEVAFVRQPLVVYHIHDGEQITKSFVRKIGGLERINEKNAAQLKKDPKTCWSRYIKLVPMYAGNRQLGKALTLWARAVCKCPLRVGANLRYALRAMKLFFKKG